jgi:hypothetical protein
MIEATHSTELESIQQSFRERFADIEKLAHAQHRHLHGDRHDDAVSETLARTWYAYSKMAQQGQDPAPLLSSMVRYAAKHVRAGKLLGRNESRRDLLSRFAREKADYFVTSLPHADDEEAASEVRDSLADRLASPAEEAITNVDYQAWLTGLSEKQREVALGLADGLNPTDIAHKRGVSKASVQQIQNTLARKWEEFHGETPSR